tara:strand:+ start:109 stop:810 length:702 start_codon:yes stop_codon:yes gene_type:complete
VLEKILVSNQDKASRTMLRYLLEIEGYAVEESSLLDDTCAMMQRTAFDLVLLDAAWDHSMMEQLLGRISQGEFGDALHLILVLPEQLPLETRAYYQQVAISHQIQRPFSPRDLVAMIRRCTHHGRSNLEQDLSALEVCFNEHQLTVTIDEKTIRFAKIEFDLFRYFFMHPNNIFSRKDLLNAIWGKGSEIEERTVDVHIRRLRRGLKPFQLDKQIQTVHGAGYRFAEAVVMAG